MDKKNLITIIIVAAVVGGVAFYGGMMYAGSKSTAKNGSQQRNGGNFQGGGGRQGGNRMNGGGFVSGDVIKKDDKSLTVQLRDGGSKVVYFSASTTISKSAKGSKDDIKVGETVMINGVANSDGSVAAQNVQIRPEAPRQNNQ